jgi:aminoglycoside/choline kinase family phosphotransferase
MITTKNVMLLVVVVLVLFAGWYLYGPSGGNLTSLNQSNFAAQFPAQFDSAANDERVLLLLSPT